MHHNQYAYLDQYQIIKTLGVGFHAKVKLAQSPNQNLVAIKKFKKQTSDISTLQHQLNILSKLHHQNIVNLIDVRPNATYKKRCGLTYTCFAIVIEYAGGGQLFDFVALTGRFSPSVSRTYFLQLISGLNYMHSNGYVHRDIKPQNILLTDNFILKLADFGFSTLLEGRDKSGYLHTRLGTQGYMAPQIQNKNYLGVKADIFSAGVILFIMYTATPPFQKSSPTDPRYKLIKDKKFTQFWIYHSRTRLFDFFEKQFKDLIQKILAFNPQQRISIQDIMKHNWMKGQIHQMRQIKQEFKMRKQIINTQLLKQKQQKQHKKIQKQVIINHEQYSSQKSSEISNFLTDYSLEKKHDILPLKSKLQKGDYVIKEQQVYQTKEQRLRMMKTRQHLVVVACQDRTRSKHNQIIITNNRQDINYVYRQQYVKQYKITYVQHLSEEQIVNMIRRKFIQHQVHISHW